MPAHLKRAAELGLSAVTVEGALIAPAEIARIAATPSDQKSAADYGCPKGTTLKDEIARYFRIGQALWQGYSRIEAPTIQHTAEFAKAQLEGVFGFSGLTGPVEHQKEGHRFRLAWEAKGGRVPVVCAAPTGDDDGFKRALPEFGDGQSGPMLRRSPTTLLQEWLNANPDFLWGLVLAGDRLRLMRDNASLTRPAWIEADLGAIYRDEMFADFTALWLLIHASRFGAEGAAAADCALERWREAGQRAGTAVREKLRGSVEDALSLLGQGFLDANPDLRERLADGRLTTTSWFEQLLRLVYRLIFLAVAEDRDLLHSPDAKADAKQLYAENYGFSYLRDRSARRQGRGRHADAYEGAKIVFRALVHGEKLLGLPALGGLFAPGLTPDLDDARLQNRAFLAAVFKLAWLIGANGRERINWRDMATEELGSVYEGLLELVPVVEGGATFAFAGGAEAKGNARKVSGSYYTPDSLVQNLLDSALDPVLDRAEAEGGADAILNLNVIDPACGSGHFLLGAARRMANRVAQIRDPDAPDYQAAMRDVVRRCIHGVDRNPMAVELAKVALWIEAIEPGKPLGFLDANIRCGDSLLGVFDLATLEDGIPDDAYKPLTGDDKATAKFYATRNKAEKKGQGSFDWTGGGGSLPPARVAASFADVLALPEDTITEVEAKRRKFEAWVNDPRRQNTKVACDLYLSAFLLPKIGGSPAGNTFTVPTTADIRTKLSGGSVFGPREAAAVNAAAEARAFHWPLIFPDVMIARGGFDVVLGNPPWEVVQLGEEEYFAARAPQIAEMKGAARKRAIAALEAENPKMFEDFEADKRRFEAVNQFARLSARFPLTAQGKINTYALFSELTLHVLNKGGRAGIIVQSGIITDNVNSAFFQSVLKNGYLVSFYDLVNKDGIFPGIHRTHPHFCLLNLTRNQGELSRISFFNTTIDHVKDDRRLFSLTASSLNLLSPNNGVCPAFRSARDEELTRSIHQRVPVFIQENGQSTNPWDAQIGQNVFSHTTDADHFASCRAAALENRLALSISALAGSSIAPLYEGKMVDQYDHRFGSFAERLEDRGNRVLPDVELENYRNPAFDPEAFFAVDRADARMRLAARGWSKDWLLVWKDITTSVTDRTLKASVIPWSGTDDTLTVLAPQPECRELYAALLANLNSLPLDYVARQKVTGVHLRRNVFVQLPILPPHAYSGADFNFIVPRVLELSYTSHSMAPFARDLGYDGEPFAWDEDRRAQLRAELDAFYALAYGLSRDELRYVLDPKEVMGADYPSETFRVLQNNERKKYGEYRTARLVLAAYDQMVREGRRPRVEGWR